MADDAPVRIGLLVGSLRTASFSRLLGKCLPDLAPPGLSITELPSIGGLPLFNHDLMQENVPETVAALASGISACDGLVVISPEYNWSIPGVLKNALDWLSRLDPMPLRNLPVTIFTCSPGLLGGARAHAPIRNVLHSLDCRILARPEVQIAQIAAKLDREALRVSDAQTADFLKLRLADFERFVRREKRLAP